MYNLYLYEAFSELDRLYEDENINNIPDEVKKLIAKGVPVLAEEPDFIEEETDSLNERLIWSDSQVRKHMGDYDHGPNHVATKMQNLWELENKNGGPGGYKFSNLIRKWSNGGMDWYKQKAENLAEAEVDDVNVKCFICQDTSKVDDEHSATKKYRDTGEARRNLDTTFRICKYRKNPALKIPANNLYYYNYDTGEEGPKPTKDFVFADHNIYEVVYYTYESYYADHGYGDRDLNTRIISYFLKPENEIEADIASAEHVFNTGRDKSRTMSRYSNKIDIRKIAKEASAQVVCFVLSFAEQNRKYVIQADFYNNPADAQLAYANDMHAFYVGIYNGSSLSRLKGKDTIEKDKVPYIKYIAQRSENAASERVESVIDRYGNIINGGIYADSVKLATNEDILAIVKEAIEKAERDMIHARKNVNDLYLYSDKEQNGPIVSVIVV